MANDQRSLAESIGRYVAGLAPEQRVTDQTELNRFLRWFEGTRPGSLTAVDIERFQENVDKSGADSSRRLEPVKRYLTWAHKKQLTAENLSKYVRLKRTAKAAVGRAAAPGGEALTRDGHRKLQLELDHLVDVKRAEIAQQLYDARLDRDFRENAPYDAAKQHQGEVEARIRQIETILATATLIDHDGHSETVRLGAKVHLRDHAAAETLVYVLVSAQEANPRQGRISVNSPVGRAMLDRRVGEDIEVEAPDGTIHYRIENISA